MTTIEDRTKPALMLLHGFPDCSIGMMAVAYELAHDYFVMVPDGRGINLSDVPADVAAYKIELLVSDVIVIADVLIPGQHLYWWGMIGAVRWRGPR